LFLSSQSSLTVGNRVLVNGVKSGILRYIGSVEFAQGLFCGVELDEPEGKHDGQVNDIRYEKNELNILISLFLKRYFQCKTNHGVFVPRDKVVLASRERTNVCIVHKKYIHFRKYLDNKTINRSFETSNDTFDDDFIDSK
jgi:dynactin complex subunit